jgi:hypothetical protein
MDMCLTTSSALRRTLMLVACCSPSSIMSPRLGLLGPMIAAPCVLWRVKKEPLGRHHRAFFFHHSIIFLVLLVRQSKQYVFVRPTTLVVTTAVLWFLSPISIVPRASCCLFSAVSALVHTCDSAAPSRASCFRLASKFLLSCLLFHDKP